LVRSTEKRCSFPNFSLRPNDLEGDSDPAMATLVAAAAGDTDMFIFLE
jgi:hypothetical protein